eukprot:749343-Hanusia_phi.AAC.11
MHGNEIKSGRALITADVAREIYMYSRERAQSGVSFSPTSASAALGSKYGITAKAVRDIWNKRTWGHATYLLWTDEEKQLFKHKVDAFVKPKKNGNVSVKEEHGHSKSSANSSRTRLPPTTDQPRFDVGQASSSRDPENSIMETNNNVPDGKCNEHLNRVQESAASTNVRAGITDPNCEGSPACEVGKKASFVQDGWMMCPERIAFFLKERHEIQFTESEAMEEAGGAGSRPGSISRFEPRCDFMGGS